MTQALRVAGLWACFTLAAGAAYAQKKPVSCGADVLLSVQALSANAEGTTSRLYSDRTDPTSGQPTPYLNGVDRVDARLQVDNCYLDFVMNLNLTSRKLLTSTVYYGTQTVSFVNFDGVANVPLTPNESDAGAPSLAMFCSTIPNNYGGCGIDRLGNYYVRRAAALDFNVGGDSWLSFNKATPSSLESWKRSLCAVGGDQRPCESSFVRVYHPNASTWILDPEPANTFSNEYPGLDPTDAVATQMETTRKGAVIYHREHVLPFRLVLTKLP
jgi:hypothetical protein